MKGFQLCVALCLSSASVSAFSFSTGVTSAWVRRAPKGLTLVRSEVEGAEGVVADSTVAEGSVAVKRTIESLEVDAEYEGQVKSVTDFGVFVDLGMLTDGLVHKSQLSSSFVANPADLGLEKGQTVTVRVMSVDAEKGQVSLSMKPKSEARSAKPRGERKRADMSKYEAMSAEETIEATVDSIMPYGCFVKFEDGAQGLVHISQLSVGRVENTGDAVSTGDKVQVRVLAVEDGKLQLSMKPYDANEVPPPKRERRQQDDNDDGLSSRKRPARIDDIWSDNTEPKWKELQAELTEKYTKADQYDNLLEFKLSSK